MKMLFRISLNLFTIALAIVSYQIYELTRGFADRLTISGREYFYWESGGYIQFGIPGKSWHFFNAQLALLLTALLPTYRMTKGFIRWNRKRSRHLGEHSETAKSLTERLTLTAPARGADCATGAEVGDDPMRSGNILNYASPSRPQKPEIILPSISIVCGLLQIAYICGAFGKFFTLYLMFLTGGITTSILSIVRAFVRLV